MLAKFSNTAALIKQYVPQCHRRFQIYLNCKLAKLLWGILCKNWANQFESFNCSFWELRRLRLGCSSRFNGEIRSWEWIRKWSSHFSAFRHDKRLLSLFRTIPNQVKTPSFRALDFLRCPWNQEILLWLPGELASLKSGFQAGQQHPTTSSRMVLRRDEFGQDVNCLSTLKIRTKKFSKSQKSLAKPKRNSVDQKSSSSKHIQNEGKGKGAERCWKS